jgi:hypothetical protein
MSLASSRAFHPAPLPLQWHVKLRADSREAWATYLSDSLSIRVPDPRVQAAFDANKAYLLVLWGGDRVVPGPLSDTDFRFREAAAMTSALDHLGLHLEGNWPCSRTRGANSARAISTTRPATRPQRPGVVGAGAHYRPTGDESFVTSVLCAVWRGAEWLERGWRARGAPAATGRSTCGRWPACARRSN